jgi:hypothetical protein
LFELPGVRRHHSEVGCKAPDKVHVLAKDSLQHPLEAPDDIVEVQHARLEHLPATKGEELPGERCGTVPRFLHFHQVGSERILFVQGIEGERRVVQDDAEQVVEVVRHAARETADRVHLLRLEHLLLKLPSLLFGALALRDVLKSALHGRDGS